MSVLRIVGSDGGDEPKGPVIEVKESLKTALRDQLQEVIAQPFTSTHLRRIARLCVSMADALAALERPEKLLRSRFSPYMGVNPGYDVGYGEDSDEAMAPAPNIETYGANAQRELMGAIGQIAKSLAPKPPQPSVTELVTAINMARATKDKDVEKMLRKKLEALMADAPAEEAPPVLPAAPPPRRKKLDATVVSQGGV